MLWFYIALHKLPHHTTIGLGMIMEAAGMCGSLCEPLLLRLWLSLVERIHHPRRHKIIFRAVDKQHRLMAARYHPQRRGLAKRPAITQTTEGGSCIEKRERRQAELIAQLTTELIPRTGVTTILDKGPHILWRLLT